MATKTKTTETNNERKVFSLKSFATLWIYKSKQGNKYLSGKLATGEDITGFFNSKKQNPKEPDIRFYLVDDEGNISKEEILSMWCNVTKNEKKVLSGKFNSEWVVGFFNSKATIGGKIPYINIYYQDSTPIKEEPKAEPKAEPETTTETDNDLPF